MPNVYVVGATIPRGGTFMAYHVGLILQQSFGYDLIDVQLDDKPQAALFAYDFAPPSITLAELDKHMTPADILVVNPSFSKFMFGIRLPGRKICYVQDFRTFSILDTRFDLYVSASSVVRDFLSSVYGIKSDIIAPFIQWEKLPDTLPWHKRAPNSALMYIKEGRENHVAGRYIHHHLKRLAPDLQLEILKNNELPHAEFLQKLGSVRTLVNVSLAEGFGLIALEAMALGTLVTGLDGLAGKDYLRFGVNSLTHGSREIDRIPGTIRKMLGEGDAPEGLTIQATKDAGKYTYDAFRHSWNAALKNFLSPRR